MNENLVSTSAKVTNCFVISAEDTVYTIISCYLTDLGKGVMVIYQDAYGDSGLKYMSLDKVKDHGILGKYYEDIVCVVK
jgi:hypothetical protein